MNDILFIVVDSLMQDHIMNEKYKGVTPFLDSVKSHSIIFSNVYSQGPFTEAGTLGLLTSANTLDDNNYLFRYDNAKFFITEVFKNSGYETYSLIYPTCLYSKRVFDTIDHVEYTSGMLFDVFWNQKFMHYVKLKNNKEFDKKDEECCIRLLKIIFEAWLHFLDPNHKERRNMLERFDEGYNYESVYAKVKNESNLFEKNPVKYTMDLLNSNGKSVLNGITSDFMQKFIRNETIHSAFLKNKDFCRKLKINQFLCNLKNNPVRFSTLSDLWERIKNKAGRYTFGEFVYWVENLARGRDINTSINGHDYKLLLSAGTQFSRMGDILLEKHERPRFVMAHVEEPHYFTTYFTFDSDDEHLIDSELKYADEYVSNLPDDYKGLISYDLAIRYVDKQIEKLYKRLETAGKLDNTTIVVTADHGSSYNIVPPRNISVNNCHTENYHIPFIILDSSIKARTIDVLSSNKDIIPTITEFLNIPKCKSLNGMSLFREKKDKFITTEYMGSGCPDIRRKPAYINVRSNMYLLAFCGKLTKEFSENDIYAIYDLKKDPMEIHNVKKLRNEEIVQMIEFLKKRIADIVDNNKEWL